MANFLSSLFQPIAPGLSGAINPLAFIGAGMASGDMGSALSNMAQIQQNAAQIAARQQLAQQQAEQEATRAQATQQYRQQQLAMEAVKQQAIEEHRRRQLAQGTGAMRLFTEMGGEQGTGKTFADWYSSEYKPGGAITIGGTPGAMEMGGIPTGMGRVPIEGAAPGQPQTRLVAEPGGPEDVRRRMEVDTLQNMYSDISELRKMVEDVGTETPISEKGRQMSAVRARFLGNLNTLREMGAIDEGEARRLEQQLPEPATWEPWKTGSAVLPGIKSFEEEAKRKLEDVSRVYGIEPKKGQESRQPGADEPLSAAEMAELEELRRRFGGAQ